MELSTGTQGRWVLIDTLIDDQLSLLSIGDVTYSEASVRKNLDIVGRELLIPRIKEISTEKPVIDEEVNYKDTLWRVRVEGVLSPINRVVIAIMAVFVPSGQALPPKPVVGGIEWRIMDGGHIDTVWDENMFALYEVPPSGRGSATGDMNGWVNFLIAPEDRARMKIVIDGGIANPDGRRHVVSFRILTRTRAENPGSKQLETVSVIVVDREHNVKWLRSIAREVTNLSPAMPQEMDIQSAALVRAAFDLIHSKAMFAVDTTTWQVFMTSPNWQQYGLQRPQNTYLPHSIHPQDFQIFADLCSEGRADQEGAVIRGLQEDGTYRPYRITASSGHFDSKGKRYVIVAVVPADQQ